MKIWLFFFAINFKGFWGFKFWKKEKHLYLSNLIHVCEHLICLELHVLMIQSAFLIEEFWSLMLYVMGYYCWFCLPPACLFDFILAKALLLLSTLLPPLEAKVGTSPLPICLMFMLFFLMLIIVIIVAITHHVVGSLLW